MTIFSALILGMAATAAHAGPDSVVHYGCQSLESQTKFAAFRLNVPPNVPADASGKATLVLSRNYDFMNYAGPTRFTATQPLSSYARVATKMVQLSTDAEPADWYWGFYVQFDKTSGVGSVQFFFWDDGATQVQQEEKIYCVSQFGPFVTEPPTEGEYGASPGFEGEEAARWWTQLEGAKAQYSRKESAGFLLEELVQVFSKKEWEEPDALESRWRAVEAGFTRCAKTTDLVAKTSKVRCYLAYDVSVDWHDPQ